MLGLPQDTQIRKVIPKRALYSKFALTAAEQRTFDAAVRQLVLVHEISHRTLPALGGAQTERPVFVLLLEQKQQLGDALLTKLAKLINQRLLLFWQDEDSQNVAVLYDNILLRRRLAQDAALQLDARTLDAIWDSLALQVAQLAPVPGKTAVQVINDAALWQQLDKQQQQLTKKMWAEKQPAKKLVLRQKLNQIKEQMEGLR